MIMKVNNTKHSAVYKFCKSKLTGINYLQDTRDPVISSAYDGNKNYLQKNYLQHWSLTGG